MDRRQRQSSRCKVSLLVVGNPKARRGLRRGFFGWGFRFVGGAAAGVLGLRGWGGVHQGRSWVYRPRDAEEAALALADAAARGLTVAHRGAGLSYGDLALNEGSAVVDARGLEGILSLDPETGAYRRDAGNSS